MHKLYSSERSYFYLKWSISKLIKLPARFTLKKNERLKSRKIIEELFNDGKRFSISPFRVHYRVTQNTDQPSVLQAAVSVSSRNFKKAVDRNRIKRQMREAYRLQKLSLHDRLTDKNASIHLFVIYTGKELPTYSIVYDKLGVILKKLEKAVDENTPTNS